MTRWRCIAPLLVLASLAAAPAARGGERFALVVGSDIGAPGEGTLRFAVKDAERYREALVALGGVPPENVLLLTNPARDDLPAALDTLARRIAAHPGGVAEQFQLYVAGHGDADGLHFGSAVVRWGELRAWLDGVPAFLRIALTDVCETDAGRTRGVVLAPSFALEPPPPNAVAGTVVLHATRRGEPAQESDRVQGGLFTHFWLSGLRGAADLDGDGRVTLAENYATTYRRTLQASAAAASPQHPAFELALAGAGDVVLSVPGRADARLVLPREGGEAHYLVMHLASGGVLAEVWGSAERDVILAVPATTLQVQRLEGEEVGIAEVVLAYGGERRLATPDFRSVRYEELALRGGVVELHPWSLAVGYGLAVEWVRDAPVLRHGAALGLRYRPGRWGLGLEVAAGYAAYEGAHHEVEEVDARAELLAGLTLAVGWARLRLEAGPVVAYVHQRRQRTEHERLALVGLDPGVEERDSVGGGAAVLATFEIPISARFALDVGAGGSVLGFPLATAGGTEVVPLSSVRLVIGGRIEL